MKYSLGIDLHYPICISTTCSPSVKSVQIQPINDRRYDNCHLANFYEAAMTYALNVHAVCKCKTAAGGSGWDKYPLVRTQLQGVGNVKVVLL